MRRHNEAHGNADAELFEIANVYLPRPDQPLPDEPTRLALVSGRDFRGLKGVVEALLARLHVAATADWLGRSRFPCSRRAAPAELLLGETHLGYLGEVDPGPARGAWSFAGGCSAAELEFDVLLDPAGWSRRYQPLPPFPAVVRDLSLVVDQLIELGRPRSRGGRGRRTGRSRQSNTSTRSRAATSPTGQQSVHFGMTFRHPERTLTGEEVDRAVKSVVDACARKFQASLRST